MKKLIYTLLVFGFFGFDTMAQCAMCRTTIVNNVSHGDTTALAAGLNTGILYLFFTPYLIIGVLAFLWFKHSKVNVPKISIKSRIGR